MYFSDFLLSKKVVESVTKLLITFVEKYWFETFSFFLDMDVNRFEERWRNLLIVNEYTRLKAILIFVSLFKCFNVLIHISPILF